MKKIMMVLCMIMCLFATNAFAQEVRGIETRRVIYDGEQYELKEYSDRSGNYYSFGTSDKYYGFEFVNKNSISVSVTIEVYRDGNEIGSYGKEIVLKPGEKYILKKPSLQVFEDSDSDGFKLYSSNSNSENWERAASFGSDIANGYYVKYKAYKLQ